MFDGKLRKRFEPVVDDWGRGLVDRGWTADGVTLAGLGLGLLAALMLALGVWGWLALIPLLAGRVADGLDGAVARLTQRTDFGGFLDITADMAFYGAVPLALVIRDPAANGVAGAFLLCGFYVNGASFLGYAVLAEKRGLRSKARGEKSLYFTAGLMEGGETIGFFALFCLFPGGFAPLAWLFGALCLATAISRTLLARRVFGG